MIVLDQQDEQVDFDSTREDAMDAICAPNNTSKFRCLTAKKEG